MIQPDHELAGKIADCLRDGARNLDPAVAESLLAARKLALSRYQDERAPVWGWAGAVQAIGSFGQNRQPSALQMLIAGAALIAALIGVAYWQGYSPQGSEIAEVDLGLLTDELPINAYLDRGFDSWLKRSSR